MRIQALKLFNFRRIQELELTFDQDFVVLVGPNASGKTTVLEAIYYSSVLQAFPPGKTWELIRFGENFFRLGVTAEDQKLEFYYGKKGDKRYERSQTVNGVRKKANEAFGNFPVATFLPQDLNLLQLSPGLRREYLDEILLQTDTAYESVMSEYAKVLIQRNELLNRIGAGQAKEVELDFWDGRLAALGNQIVTARKNLCDFLQKALPNTYSELVGEKLDCRFHYITELDEPNEEGMLKRLFAARKGDIASGRTSVGPHRDDWKVRDESQQDLSHFLSRGEQRSLISALKVLETDYLEEALGKPPVILLDELLAELDGNRRRSIVSKLPKGTQKFLTTTELAEVPQDILTEAQILEFTR
ncbi:MAG: DNA replication and repair protein RecF [Patescibacteria group bacterium]|nr:DNA replication and repair protein RecF [Patescibacteria group bacterium]